LDGRSIIREISDVVVEEVGRGREPLPIAQFKDGGKPWVINRRNGRYLAAEFGDDTDGWKGKVIELYPLTVDFGGRPTPTVRARLPRGASKASHDAGDEEV
jgi:hypothetical protein